MVISFTGAQSTGKSTLLERCKLDEKFRKFDFEPEVTRWVKKTYGLAINEEGDDTTQLSILSRHLHNYLYYKNKDVIMDRCILDGLVYTTYQYCQEKVSRGVYDYAELLFKKLIDKVDIIFYTEPDIELVDDGERSVDEEFRETIIKLFEEAIDHYDIKVVRLSGSVENRMNIIYNTVNNYGK